MHWVDAILALTIVEGALLWWWHRRTGRGVAPSDFGLNWMSGLCLMVAVRVALSGSGPASGAVFSATLGGILLCLSAAGALHGIDLWRRWR